MYNENDWKWAKEYIENNKKVGVFGIKYLDDKLKGILKGDLILIGARSGAGKTTLSNIISMANAKLDKKIALFSLENFTNDNLMEKAYYFYKEFTQNFSLDLRDFVQGNFVMDLDNFKKASYEAKMAYKNVNIINRQAGYDTNKLKQDIIKQANNGIDLIILDHLDYIDRVENENNENDHMTVLMRTIRQIQNETKVAIVAISHLRKNYNTKESPKIPSIDEFIGSSNKVKEATAVIMFAPDDETNYTSTNYNLRNTWCCIRKLRMGGIDNTAAKLIFDTKTGSYRDIYTRYKVNYSGTQTVEIKEV